MEFLPQEIAEVYHQISPHIVNTPIIHSANFSELCHCHTLLKLENLQMTGSFKEPVHSTDLINAPAPSVQEG